MRVRDDSIADSSMARWSVSRNPLCAIILSPRPARARPPPSVRPARRPRRHAGHHVQGVQQGVFVAVQLQGAPPGGGRGRRQRGGLTRALRLVW